MISDEIETSQVVAASAIGFADCYNPFLGEQFTDLLNPKRGLGPCINVCGEFLEKFVEEKTEKGFSDLVSCISVKWECDSDYENLKNLEPLSNNRMKRLTREENIALKVMTILGQIGMILASFLG